MVDYVGMRVKSKKRSRSSDEAGTNRTRNASQRPVRNKKRQLRNGEDVNSEGGGGGGRGKEGKEEEMQKSENDLVDESSKISESRRRKRKRVEKHDAKDGRVVKDSDGTAVAREAGNLFRSAIDAEANSSETNAVTTTNAASTLTPLQIQLFNIPDKVIKKVFSHDWDLLCIKVRQSSRIRCKIRAALAHLFLAEADQHQKKNIHAKEHQRGNQPRTSNETSTDIKDHNDRKSNGIRSSSAKKPTPILLLQASADAASKLISIVEIVKRESAQNQQSYTCFQYSGIEGRVEELRSQEKHKKRGSDGNIAKAASINVNGKGKTSKGSVRQQDLSNGDADNDHISGGFHIKDASNLTADGNSVRNSSVDEPRCAETTLMNTHISDSELGSEPDAFQTLAESRKKLRNMPYLTIYLSGTKIPLLNNAYG